MTQVINTAGGESTADREDNGRLAEGGLARLAGGLAVPAPGTTAAGRLATEEGVVGAA